MDILDQGLLWSLLAFFLAPDSSQLSAGSWPKTGADLYDEQLHNTQLLPPNKDFHTSDTTNVITNEFTPSHNPIP